MLSSEVRLWHKADIPTSSRDVRFWGQSGHEPTLTTVQRRGDVPTVVWADRAGHMAKSHLKLVTPTT
jgi:hypothetical protein